MTEKEYRQHPAVSRSELFHILDSPEKFRYYKDNPIEPTPALIFGQAFHKMALEPDSFNNEFAVLPNVDRRTKEGKTAYAEFLEQSESKTVITEADLNKCTEMCAALKKASFLDKLLSGEKEKPFFWTDEMTGEQCKCRVDCLSEVKELNIIVDLKSAAKADYDSFIRDAIKYGYDFQSAMYTEGVKASTGKECIFVFIVIEKEPPYAVNIFQADPILLRRGGDLFREAMGIYHDCNTTGNWYGYLGKFNQINNLSLPAWLAKEYE